MVRNYGVTTGSQWIKARHVEWERGDDRSGVAVGDVVTVSETGDRDDGSWWVRCAAPSGATMTWELSAFGECFVMADSQVRERGDYLADIAAGVGMRVEKVRDDLARVSFPSRAAETRTPAPIDAAKARHAAERATWDNLPSESLAERGYTAEQLRRFGREVAPARASESVVIRFDIRGGFYGGAETAEANAKHVAEMAARFASLYAAKRSALCAAAAGWAVPGPSSLAVETGPGIAAMVRDVERRPRIVCDSGWDS